MNPLRRNPLPPPIFPSPNVGRPRRSLRPARADWQGGFGLVFVASKQEPVKRRVALKVIQAGMDSKQVIARFEAGAASVGIDGSSQHRPCPRRWHHRVAPAVLRDGARARHPDHDYCDHKSTHAAATSGALSSPLPCHPARPPKKGSFIATSSRRTCWSRRTMASRAKVIDFGVGQSACIRLNDRTIYTKLRAKWSHAAVHEARNSRE